MSLEKIKETVLKSSRSEAEHITASASRQATEKLEFQKESLRQEFEYLFQSRSRLIEEEYSRKLAHFQGTAAKELLEAKNACIRSIFEKARAEVLAWPPVKYAGVMKALLERITDGRGGNVRVHVEDKGTFDGILGELNGKRDERTRLNTDNAGTLSERGGFIFISGDFEVDATMGTIFGDIERSLLPGIAQDLADI